MESLIEQLHKLERIHTLIRLKATGTPKDFAKRLGVSKRTLERLLQQMREQGFPITYDTARQSYFYHNEVKFSFQLYINGEKEISIKGGKVDAPPIFGGPLTDICNDNLVERR